MVRLGRRDEALALVAALPIDWALATYLESRIRGSAGWETSRSALRRCVEGRPDAAWCHLGLAQLNFDEGKLKRGLREALTALEQRPTPQTRALLARFQARSGRSKQALSAARQARDLDPEAAVGHIAVGEALLAMRQMTAAKLALDTAVAIDVDGVEALTARARFRQLTGDMAGAQDDLRAALNADDHVRYARASLASILLAEGRYGPALSHLNVLVERHPQTVRYLVQLGRALLLNGAAGQALGWADLALSGQPDNIDALQLRAEALVGTGDLQSALSLRARLYALSADADVHQIGIAKALARSGRHDLAVAEFESGAIRDPRSGQLWRAYTQYLLDQKQLDQAIAVLRRGATYVEDAFLQNDLRLLLEKRGDLKGALGAATEAARIDPIDPDLSDEAARLAFANGAPDVAIAAWRRLLDRRPRADRARLRLSDALRKTGDSSGAIVQLKILGEFHPEDGTVRFHLGQTLLHAGRTKEAVAAFEAAVALGVSDTDSLPLLAASLADVGRVDAAAKAFESAVESDPSNRALRLMHARFLVDRNEPERALSTLRGLLNRDPNDDQAIAALIRLLGPEETARWVGEVLTRPALATDPVLQALARQATTPEGDALGTVLRDERHVEVDAKGIVGIRHLRSILLQRPQAAERYRTARIAFHADHPPKVLKARVFTPDGEILQVTDRRVINPHDGSPMFGDARQLELVFPRLEPGSVIDYEVYTPRPRISIDDAWWDAYPLGNTDRTILARYALTLPANAAPQVFAPKMGDAEDTRLSDGRRRLVWTAHRLPGFTQRTVTTESMPSVHVSSLANWRAVDAWYSRLFNPRSKASPAVAHRAQSLTRGPLSRAQKIAAVYRNVEESVDYLGIEFGVGAYQPRPAESTLAQGRGDCKDMTALMVAMLAESGIAAYPALLRPRDQGAFIPTHASPGQFSHVLLYVPGRDGPGEDEPAIWLDATAGLHTVGALPDAVRGRAAFVVDGHGGRMLSIPEAEAEAHHLDQTLTFELNETGGGTVTAKVELTGDLAGSARRRLLALVPEARSALIRSAGFLLDGVRSPQSAAVRGVSDPLEPLIFTGRLADPDLVAARLNGSLVIPFDAIFLQPTSVPVLGAQARLGAARVIQRRIELVPPSGYTFAWEPLSYRRDLDGVRIEVDEHRAAGRATITTRLVLEKPRRKPSDELALANSLEAARSALKQKLVMAPGPNFDAIRFLGTIADERPDDERIQAHFARALLEKGALDRARRVLDRALDKHPDDPQLLSLLTGTLLRLDAPAEAEVPLRTLSNRPDAPPELHLTLASVLVQSGRTRAAVLALQGALSRFPRNPAIRRRLIRYQAKLGKLSRSIVAAQALAIERPTDAEAQLLLAELADRAGRRALAEGAYLAALGLDPNQAGVLSRLAWMLRDTPPRLKEALDYAERAVVVDPTSIEAWDILALIRLRSGNPVGAAAARRRGHPD